MFDIGFPSGRLKKPELLDALKVNFLFSLECICFRTVVLTKTFVSGFPRGVQFRKGFSSPIEQWEYRIRFGISRKCEFVKYRIQTMGVDAPTLKRHQLRVGKVIVCIWSGRLVQNRTMPTSYYNTISKWRCINACAEQSSVTVVSPRPCTSASGGRLMSSQLIILLNYRSLLNEGDPWSDGIRGVRRDPWCKTGSVV